MMSTRRIVGLFVGGVAAVVMVAIGPGDLAFGANGNGTGANGVRSDNTPNSPNGDRAIDGTGANGRQGKQGTKGPNGETHIGHGRTNVNVHIPDTGNGVIPAEARRALQQAQRAAAKARRNAANLQP
jgi:hypothetical protein